MYPVFSPSNLDIKIKVFSKGKEYTSASFKFFKFVKTIRYNSNDFVESKKLKDDSFTIMAYTKKKKSLLD